MEKKIISVHPEFCTSESVNQWISAVTGDAEKLLQLQSVDSIKELSWEWSGEPAAERETERGVK